MTPRFVKFYCCRLNRDWYVNPENVLSFYAEGWPHTQARTAIEVKGQQGYGNHTLYVEPKVDEVNDLLTPAAVTKPKEVWDQIQKIVHANYPRNPRAKAQPQ
jgi:ABC-type transport system substrate-binding protein